jgi:hypothetical protein
MLNLLWSVTIGFLLVGTGENQWPEWKFVESSLQYQFRCRSAGDVHTYECQLKRNDGEAFALPEGKCFFFDVGSSYQTLGRFCPTGDKLPLYTATLVKVDKKPRRCALGAPGDAVF